MGVVYKFKQEVVDFVLVQKKQNPSLSCRKLAEITSSQFQTKVSKSSINSILKDCNLSNEVGRPKIDIKPVFKFEIPKEKKNIIADNLRLAGGDLIKQEDQAVPLIKEEIVQKDTIQEKEEALLLLPDPVHKEALDLVDTEQRILKDKFYKKVKNQREKYNNTPFQEYTGLIFLTAAQWLFTQKSFLGQLIRKNTSQELSPDFEEIINRIFLQKAINAKQQQGLWFMNNFNSPPSIQQNIENNLKEEELGKLSAQFSFELQKLDSFIGGFQIHFKDGAHIIIDAGLSGLGKKAVPLPLTKAVEILSAALITNKECIIIGSTGDEENISKQHYELLQAFQNADANRIIKIALLDLVHKELTSFSIIPRIKRFYIAGMYPYLKEFKEITKSAQWAAKNIYYHKPTDKIYQYTHTKTDFLGKDEINQKENASLITLFEEQNQLPVCSLITNLDMTGEQIIKMYLNRWPNFSLDATNPKTMNFIKKDRDKTEDILIGFKLFLEAFLQEKIVPEFQHGVSWEEIYNLPGKIIPEQEYIYVSFKPINKDPLRQLVASLIKKLNMMDIRDFEGKKLFFSDF